MKIRPLALVALVLCLVPSLAFAHPGHGDTDPDTWRHYLTEPVHVIVIAALAGVVLVSWLGYRRRRGTRTIR